MARIFTIHYHNCTTTIRIVVYTVNTYAMLTETEITLKTARNFENTCLLTVRRHLILVIFASKPFHITAVGKNTNFCTQNVSNVYIVIINSTRIQN